MELRQILGWPNFCVQTLKFWESKFLERLGDGQNVNLYCETSLQIQFVVKEAISAARNVGPPL